jgi:predicted ATPase/class 3 adenylate cyclase
MAFTSGGVDPGRPTGTVTFLFTDIEGSTQRWEHDRDAMRTALARHDAVMREAIATRGGCVFKTVGDAFCAAFATAPQAVAAALDAQRALQAEDFASVSGVYVRMALHTGTAQERDADYFGPAVNRVARLLAIGHGGQVLVSRTAAELLEAEMPERSSLRDLGAHQLKDLTQPEQVFQLVADGLPEKFPALRSLGQFPTNLPPALTSFVGRDEEIAAIKRLIKENRLVTLVGTGGVGKTRCAIQVGAELLDGFSDGVWLTELASISDASLVPAAIARALGVREAPNRAPLHTLLAHLESRHLLLVIDNCEHVIAEVRNVAAAVLRGALNASIVATSRESLSIGGERAFVLPSLAVPASCDALSADAALRYDAIALFNDRARASDARFALTDENTPCVAEITARLDGIPLAIELAAARVKVLSPQQLVSLLNERFRVLTGGDRSALPRHQTMRALIDWSFDLLSDEERALFRKLAIFAGGFALDTATAVCGNDTTDAIAVLDVLSSLVDKSLVQADRENGRYRLLESTRQYAREKLGERGEYQDVARAHAEAFLALAERIERAQDMAPDREWLAQAEPELENWRAALVWAFGPGGDLLLGQRLAAANLRAWSTLAVSEGRRWIRTALDRADATTPSAVVAHLDLAEAMIDGMLGLHKASYVAAERALAAYRELGHRLGIANAQRQAGRSLVFIGRIPEGEALLREALETFRASGGRALTGAVLENLAIARNALGDLSGAREFYAEALEIFKAIGADRLASSVANNLAESEFRGGNAEEALRLAADALDADRAPGFTNRAHIFPNRLALQLCNIAAYLLALGRFEQARSRAREALSIARDAHYEVGVLWAIQHLTAANVLQHGQRDDPEYADSARAARLIGYVDERLAALEARREFTEEREYEAMLAALCERFDEKQFASLTAEGRSWREDQAMAEALLL